MPTIPDLWNETAATIERVTAQPFALRIELVNARFWRFRKTDDFDARIAIATLHELARRNDIGTDLKWRVNWMRDLLVASGLVPTRRTLRTRLMRVWA